MTVSVHFGGCYYVPLVGLRRPLFLDYWKDEDGGSRVVQYVRNCMLIDMV